MGTTAEKLAYLADTKTAIKDAIVAKGVEVSEGTTFREYAEKISDIEQSKNIGPTNWVKGLNTTDSFQCLIYEAGIWLSGGEQGLYRSENGKDWSKVELNDWINNLAYGKGIFVAACDLGLYYSTDKGITWNYVDTGIQEVISYVYYMEKGVFCAVSRRHFYSSKDGINWEYSSYELTNLASFGLINDTLFLKGENKYYVSTDGENLFLTNFPELFLTRIVYYNGMYISGAFDNSNPISSEIQGIYHSIDGQTWEKATINFESYGAAKTFGCITIEEAFGILFAGGNYDQGIYTSIDGRTWNKLQLDFHPTVFNLIYHNGMLLMAYLTGQTGQLARSFDGKIWENSDVELNTSSVGTDKYIFNISGVWYLHKPSQLFEVGKDAFYTYYSVDGLHWYEFPFTVYNLYMIENSKINVMAIRNTSSYQTTGRGIYYSANWESESEGTFTEGISIMQNQIIPDSIQTSANKNAGKSAFIGTPEKHLSEITDTVQVDTMETQSSITGE